MQHSREASHYDSSFYVDSTPLPPWEKDDINQVPYMDGASPSLSNAEREALPSLWATRTSTVSGTRPALHADTSHSSGSCYYSPGSPESYSSPWKVKTPLTAPPIPVSRYETPIYVPPGPKSAPNPPCFVKAPPTPPDSLARSSTTTSSYSSPRPKQTTTAMPGTMSSRNARDRTPSRTRTGSSSREPYTRKHDKRGRMPFGRRWKLVFKDMFTRDPVDDSQFETIEDRHWTDE